MLTWSEVPDSLLLGGHKGVVSSLILLGCIRDKLDVSLFSSTDMSDS